MKKIIAAVVVSAFVLSAGAVFAAKCTVDSVEGNKVTVTCAKAGVRAGDSVPVTAAAQGLEDC